MPAICEGTVETNGFWLAGWMEQPAKYIYKRNLIDE